MFALNPVALAQDALDLHGLTPAPPGPDASAPMLVYAPLDGRRTSSIRVMAELADTTAVRLALVGGEEQEAARLATVGAIGLAGQFALSRRVAMAGSWTLFAWTRAGDLDGDGTMDGGGPALGDLVLSVPVGLLMRPRGEGFGLGVVPFIRLPTGNERRFLGTSGLSVGGMVAAGYGQGRFRADLNLGLGRSAQVMTGVQTFGGWQLPVGGAAAVRLVSDLWLGAEVRGRVDVTSQSNEPTFDVGGSPVEAFVTLRAGSLGGRRALSGAVGRGLTSGLGAANARAFLSGTQWFGPDEAELPWEFVVLGPSGRPVRNAEVLEGNKPVAKTDPQGMVISEVRWNRGVSVGAPGHVTTSVEAPSEGQRVEVVLPYADVPLLVRLSDEEGGAVNATVTATPIGGGTPVVGPVHKVALAPGTTPCASRRRRWGRRSGSSRWSQVARGPTPSTRCSCLSRAREPCGCG